VVDGERLRVELVEGEPATRQLVACEHWPIVAARAVRPVRGAGVVAGPPVLISVGASGQLGRGRLPANLGPRK
jgi:hypothetical protein